MGYDPAVRELLTKLALQSLLIYAPWLSIFWLYNSACKHDQLGRCRQDV